MTSLRAVAVLALLAGVAVASCGGTATSPPSVAAAPSAAPTAPATAASPATASPAPSPTPAPTASPSPTSSPTPSPTPSPAPTATPAATIVPPSKAPYPATDAFWNAVARGIRDARRLEVDVDGPTPGTLRFEAVASATVIEGTIGFVCVGGRAYDGQSAFTALPGTWTCGAAALVAGFRHIGQPIDAWNTTVPSDDARRESVSGGGDTLVWSYRATSAYYGGPITVELSLDTATRRITAATREDPTGITTYTFRYGAAFPAIAVPR